MNDMEPLGSVAAGVMARAERIMQRRQQGTETIRALLNNGELATRDLPCYDRCDGDIVVMHDGQRIGGFCPMHMVEGVCPLTTVQERKLLVRLKHAGFGSHYFHPEPERIRARQIVEQYLGTMETNLAEGRGLVFTGDVGTGKTFTLAYMARRLLTENVGVRKILFPMFISELEDRSKRMALVQQAIKAEVLMIDDFGSGEIAPWMIGVVEGIVESRYGNNKPTIVTTNLSREALVSNEMFRRMVDRWRECCTMVAIGGTSMRHKDESA